MVGPVEVIEALDDPLVGPDIVLGEADSREKVQNLLIVDQNHAVQVLSEQGIDGLDGVHLGQAAFAFRRKGDQHGDGQVQGTQDLGQGREIAPGPASHARDHKKEVRRLGRLTENAQDPVTVGKEALLPQIEIPPRSAPPVQPHMEPELLGEFFQALEVGKRRIQGKGLVAPLGELHGQIAAALSQADHADLQPFSEILELLFRRFHGDPPPDAFPHPRAAPHRRAEEISDDHH